MVERFVAWTRRHPHAVALSTCLVLVTLPFIEVLLGSKTAMWGDTNAAHVPRYAAAWVNLRHGASPFWWGNMFGGFNALGAGQSAVFYLPNAIFGWIAPIAAFRWWFFFHLWLMCAGWYCWSWRRWRSITGASISALAAVLSGFFVYHSMFMPYIAALALTPWIFLSLDLLIQTGRLRYCSIIALLLAPIVLLGLPQFLWLLLIALGVLSVFELARRGTSVRTWVLVGSSVVLGVALGAVQLLTQLAFSKTSVRPSLDRAGAFEYSMEARHLLTLVAPNVMGGTNHGLGWSSPWLGGGLQHEVSNYLGITFLAVAVLGAISVGRSRLNYAMGLISILGITSSLGGRTPVGSFFYRFVPFADHFRVWGRNQLWVTIAVAILAGAGGRELVRNPARSARRLVAASVVILGGFLLLPAFTNLGGALVSGREGVVARVLPGLLVLALGGAIAVLPRRRFVGLVLVVAVCAIDGSAFTISSPWRGLGLKPSDAGITYSSSPPFFGRPSDQGGGIDRWVSDVPDASSLWPVVIGHPTLSVNGYDPLIQKDYSDTLGGMVYNGYMPGHDLWSGSWIPDILRTTTLLASPYAGQPSPGWTPYGQAGGYTLYSYAPRLADSYLVGASRVGTLDDARTGISNPTSDLQSFAFVDVHTLDRRDVPAFATLTEPGSSGTVVDGAMGEGGYGRWTVSAARPSLFVASWVWTEGWHATVDGKAAPVARTNALVLGVPVPSGVHVVRLWFTPPGWKAGKWISIAAGVVVLLLLALDNRRLLGHPRLAGLVAGRFSSRKKPEVNEA